MQNELITASFMVMVLRKANIIFGCIKRSILYRIRDGGLFSIALSNEAFGSGLGGRNSLPGRQEKPLPEEQPEDTNIRSQNGNDLGLCLWMDSRKDSLQEWGPLLLLLHTYIFPKPQRLLGISKQ